MHKVVHFEIPADDMARAQQFYAEVFGWNTVSLPDMKYTMVHTGPTTADGMLEDKGFINGGVFNRGADLTAPLITIDTDDIEASMTKIEAQGGKKIRDKVQVGDMGWVAYFQDSEGNVVGLWQNLR